MTGWKDKSDFKNAVYLWAEKLDVKVISLYLRPMKSKWASCSEKGHLNFNDELLSIDRKLGEYVIVHELLHFRAANHGALWKTYMSAYLPEWEDLDRQLKIITNKEREL